MSRYVDADNLPRHGNRGGVVYWRDIEAQPTADVRENIKGYWKFDGQFYYQCSECSFKAPYRYNYCPGCGAEMCD